MRKRMRAAFILVPGGGEIRISRNAALGNVNSDIIVLR